ncbi:hypothetical protein ACRZ5S_22805 (plasmid) [Vibrio scophthalmi]|uniref:hypothetical protein n=1 Tax=Vibrio scophthalmi TaxID=45658 RepID=UPI003EBC61AC
MRNSNFPISKFASFVLAYKGKDGVIKKRKFEDTTHDNVYRVARSFPQGVIWKIRQL